jgi:predicted transglutaminase-like cysteine proteinase
MPDMNKLGYLNPRISDCNQNALMLYSFSRFIVPSQMNDIAQAVYKQYGRTTSENMFLQLTRAVHRCIGLRTDSANYGRPDCTSYPASIRRKGYGDCEDYAVLMLSALRCFTPASRMLSCGTGTYFGSTAHMVTAVSIHGVWWLCDAMYGIGEFLRFSNADYYYSIYKNFRIVIGS